MLEKMGRHLWNAYCEIAPGAVAPLQSLLEHFGDEVQAHIEQQKCPFK
jgi:NADH-quinone oxidoreductase subunit F